MARSPVALRAIAARDIESVISHYLDEAGKSVALQFIDDFEEAITRIGSSPTIGSLRFSFELGIPELRAWPLSRFPYVAFYVAAADRVDVWRVLHSRRDLPAELAAGSGL